MSAGTLFWQTLGLAGALLVIVLLLAWPLGGWLARLATGELPPGLKRVEGIVLRVSGAGVAPGDNQTWWRYALSVLAFGLVGVVSVYALQRFQASLPFNPQALGAVSADSSLNTAVSFVTNTNWQGYGGESTMGYLVQALGLAVHNFLSAATGIAVALALVRAMVTPRAAGIGSFWVDLVRVTLWLLLPLSVLFAVFLMARGVVQTWAPYASVTTLEGATQTVALGPVASQEAIKMIGTNGGGFFNANSAHPFENPDALVNFLQMLSMLLIPAALVSAFGRLAGDRRQGVAVLATMVLLFVGMLAVAASTEGVFNPALSGLGLDPAGGNMEGKEVRFGGPASVLFAAITTATSCGAVNAMHDSLMPLAGMVPLWLMQLGEVVFGGVGSGLYGMLVFAVLAVFVAGLMIGRTPEYLGKKIGAREMKMVSLAILVTPFLVLGGTAAAVLAGAGRAGIANPGAHGFSEILYALSSAGNNNGSAFAGLSANTPFYNLLLGVVMWVGRFAVIVPVLALAGSLAARPRVEPGAGTLPTHGPLFVGLLTGVVLIFGALTYLPALALGPVADHLGLVATKPAAGIAGASRVAAPPAAAP